MKKYIFAFILLTLFTVIDSYSIEFRDLGDIADEVANKLKDIKGVKVLALWRFKDDYNSGFDLSFFESMIMTRLTSADLDFRIRDRAFVEKAIEEYKLSVSGAIDQNQIKEIGKAKGIDTFMYGEVYPLYDFDGNKINYIMSIKLIKGETGEIIFATDVGLENEKSKDWMDELINDAILDEDGSFEDKLDRIKESGVKRIAVLGIETSGTKIDANMLANKVMVNLLKIKGIVILDRQNLGKIMEELRNDIKNQALYDDNIKEFGKLYSVDAFLYGKIRYDWKKKKAILLLKLSTVEERDILWAKDVSIERTVADKIIGKVAKAVKTAARGVAWYITQIPGIGLPTYFYMAQPLIPPSLYKLRDGVPADEESSDSAAIQWEISMDIVRIRLLYTSRFSFSITGGFMWFGGSGYYDTYEVEWTGSGYSVSLYTTFNEHTYSPSSWYFLSIKVAHIFKCSATETMKDSFGNKITSNNSYNISNLDTLTSKLLQIESGILWGKKTAIAYGFSGKIGIWRNDIKNEFYIAMGVVLGFNWWHPFEFEF